MIGETLLAVLAGVLLNLTPCVLPAIPLKIRVILREAGHKAPQRWLAAMALLAGSLSFFLALGVATAFLQWTWGALFQSRLFLIILVAVLSAAGTASFVELNIRLPEAVYRVRGRRYLEPFLIGSLTGLLSTPCTGPFLGGVLAFAVTNPPMVILWLFAAVGFGLALPYVGLLLHPQWLQRLPRGGEWTVRVVQALGFVLLAGAVFFAQSLVSPPWDRVLWWLWAAAVAIWGVVAWLRSNAWSARLVPTLVAVLAGLTVYAGAITPTSTAASLKWQPLLAGTLPTSMGNGRAVLVEFTADWCINCKVLERTVYVDPQVVQAAQDTGIATLQADLTRPDARLEQLLSSFGGVGLPFAVILDANGEVVRRLPDLFSAETLSRAIYASAEGDHADEVK